MIIRIIDDKSFQIVEQSNRRMTRSETHTPIGTIEVMCSSYPDISYVFFTCSNELKVFVRGEMPAKDNRHLVVKSSAHMSHVLQALKEFCTFNGETLEIESCIL